MNPRAVIKELEELIHKRVSPIHGKEGESDASHLYYMCAMIKNGDVQGEKAHRWLGYIQGVMCRGGHASLKEMKTLNTPPSLTPAIRFTRDITESATGDCPMQIHARKADEGTLVDYRHGEHCQIDYPFFVRTDHGFWVTQEEFELI